MSIVTHLEMTEPTQLRAKAAPFKLASLYRVPQPLPALNRFFYHAIGKDWAWTDRRPWSLVDWYHYVNRPELETWIVAWSGMPAGYCELERQAGDNVEIVYFGILPEFTTMRLGGWFLSEMIRHAWTGDTKRVWVHTCDADHPAALPNYLARGFQIFNVVDEG